MDVHLPNEKGRPICWNGELPTNTVLMHSDIYKVTCVLCLHQYIKEISK